MNDRENINEWKPGIRLMTDIDDEFVSEALASPKRKPAASKWLYAAAACLAVLAAVVAAVMFMKKPDEGKSALVPISPSLNNWGIQTASQIDTTEACGTNPAYHPLPSDSAVPNESAEPSKTVYPTDTVSAIPTQNADGSDLPLRTENTAPDLTPTAQATATPAPTSVPTPKPTNTPKPTATPKPTNTPKPHTTPKPLVFHSEEEFQAAVLSGEHTDDSMSWVTHYYKPAEVPEEVEFSHILVNGFGIGIYYRLPGSFNEHGEPNCIVFAWYPWMDEAGLLHAVNNHTVPYETMWPYYIFFQPDYTSVYWMQDGNSFYMTSPPGLLTRENIPLYCDAVLVPIK